MNISTGIETQAVPQMITLFNPYVTSILLLLALFIGKMLFNMADIVTGLIFKKDKNVNIIQCNLHETMADELSRMGKEQLDLRKTLPIDYVRSEPYEKDIREIKDLIKNVNNETKEFMSTLIEGVNQRLDDFKKNS